MFVFVYMSCVVMVGFVVIDVSTSGIRQKREAWESQRKGYTADFFELDPCMVSRPLLLFKLCVLLMLFQYLVS